MDYDLLMSLEAVALFKSLLTYERANLVAVACFQQSKISMPEQQGQAEDWKEDIFFVSADTDDDDYSSFLRRNWSEYGKRSATRAMRPPWLIFAEIIGACSDLGHWYMYGDKFTEIALLGFTENPGAILERRLLSEFGVEKTCGCTPK